MIETKNTIIKKIDRLANFSKDGLVGKLNNLITSTVDLDEKISIIENHNKWMFYNENDFYSNFQQSELKDKINVYSHLHAYMKIITEELNKNSFRISLSANNINKYFNIINFPGLENELRTRISDTDALVYNSENWGKTIYSLPFNLKKDYNTNIENLFGSGKISISNGNILLNREHLGSLMIFKQDEIVIAADCTIDLPDNKQKILIHYLVPTTNNPQYLNIEDYKTQEKVDLNFL